MAKMPGVIQLNNIVGDIFGLNDRINNDFHKRLYRVFTHFHKLVLIFW